jgi:serine/threonine-protein kinase
LVKVLDFGISKLTGPHEQAMTSTSAVMGSALYMSPEQLQSARDVDARCDIYALGVSLFELLSGIVPYDGETMPQLVAAVLSGARRDLAALRPDLPPGLVAVVNRAMATRRDDRPASASELAEALAPFASPHGAAIGHRLADAEPSARRSLADLSSARHADPPAQGGRTAAAMVHDTVVAPPVRASRTRLWLGAVCAAIGLCGLAIWALAAGGAEATSPDAPGVFPSEAPRPDDHGAHAAASDVRDAPPSTSDAAAGADAGASGVAGGASAAAPSSTVPAGAGSAVAARGPSATPTRTPLRYTAQPQTTDAYGGRK